MSRYLVTLTALSLACTAQRRDDANSLVASVEAMASPCPALSAPPQTLTTTSSSSAAATPSPSGVGRSAARSDTHPGYLAASEYLLALFDCANGLNCDEKAKRVLEATPALAVALPDDKDSSSCGTIHGLLSSSWCGTLTEPDLADVREAVTSAVDCLTSIPSGNRPSCIYRYSRWFWIGSAACSKTDPGQVELDARRNVFEEGQSWVVELNNTPRAAWSLCLEGFGDKITSLSVRTSRPKDRTAR